MADIRVNQVKLLVSIIALIMEGGVASKEWLRP